MSQLDFCLFVGWLVLFYFLNFSPVCGDAEKQEAMKEGLYYEIKMCVCENSFEALSHIISNLIATISCNIIMVPTLVWFLETNEKT